MRTHSGGPDYQTLQRLRGVELLVAAVVILLPLAPLLLPGYRSTINDWGNTLWGVGYTKTYLARHGSFPAIFNTDRVVGHPVPMLYGPLLYPMLAIPAVAFGADWGMRVSVAGIWCLQFALVHRLIRVISESRVLAMTVGALVSWAVYPLTNLYNRGAGNELFATVFLTCAACAGTLALVEPAGG